MGQYHIPVNLTKREFINPHALGVGLKLREQARSSPGTNTALIMLLACSNGRGGGDFDDQPGSEEKVIGRWAGDRIAIVGDYATNDDLPKRFNAEGIYGRCASEDDSNFGHKNTYKDITPFVVKAMEREFDGRFEGDGWKGWVYNDCTKEQPVMCPDVVIMAPREKAP